LKAANEIGGAVQPDVSKEGGGEARLVSLVADDHDATVVVGHFGDVVLAGRVESPLEDIAIDDDCAS
jgi:hypothetical protein